MPAVMVDEHRLIRRMIAPLVEQNAAGLEAGGYRDWQFFLDAVEFIRNYEDRFHHAKEEAVLFKELVRNGMPAKNSPVAAMLLAHDQGRAFVKGMETSALRGRDGAEVAIAEVVANARGYSNLLREHIHTEDHVLYPLAERGAARELARGNGGGLRSRRKTCACGAAGALPRDGGVLRDRVA